MAAQSRIFITDLSFQRLFLFRDVFLIPLPAPTPPQNKDSTSAADTSQSESVSALPAALLVSPLSFPSQTVHCTCTSLTIGWQCAVCGVVDIEKNYIEDYLKEIKQQQTDWLKVQERLSKESAADQSAVARTPEFTPLAATAALASHPSLLLPLRTTTLPRQQSKHRLARRIQTVAPACVDCFACPRCAAYVSPSPSSSSSSSTVLPTPTRLTLCSLKLRLAPRTSPPSFYGVCPHCHWSITAPERLPAVTEEKAAEGCSGARTGATIQDFYRFLSTITHVRLQQQQLLPGWRGQRSRSEALQPLFTYLFGALSYDNAVLLEQQLLFQKLKWSPLPTPPSSSSSSEGSALFSPYRLPSRETWDRYIAFQALRRRQEVLAAEEDKEKRKKNEEQQPNEEMGAESPSLSSSTAVHPAVAMDEIHTQLLNERRAALYALPSQSDYFTTSPEDKKAANPAVLPSRAPYCTIITAAAYGEALKARAERCEQKKENTSVPRDDGEELLLRQTKGLFTGSGRTAASSSPTLLRAVSEEGAPTAALRGTSCMTSIDAHMHGLSQTPKHVITGLVCTTSLRPARHVLLLDGEGLDATLLQHWRNEGGPLPCAYQVSAAAALPFIEIRWDEVEASEPRCVLTFINLSPYIVWVGGIRVKSFDANETTHVVLEPRDTPTAHLTEEKEAPSSATKVQPQPSFFVGLTSRGEESSVLPSLSSVTTDCLSWYVKDKSSLTPASLLRFGLEVNVVVPLPRPLFEAVNGVASEEALLYHAVQYGVWIEFTGSPVERKKREE